MLWQRAQWRYWQTVLPKTCFAPQNSIYTCLCLSQYRRFQLLGIIYMQCWPFYRFHVFVVTSAGDGADFTFIAVTANLFHYFWHVNLEEKVDIIHMYQRWFFFLLILIDKIIKFLNPHYFTLLSDCADCLIFHSFIE